MKKTNHEQTIHMVIDADDRVNHPRLFFVLSKRGTRVEQTLENVPLPTPPPGPDLTEALSKRIEGKPAEAIELLRELNEQFPKSSEVLVQLGRSLIDAKEYALAAFRFEQALSMGAPRTNHPRNLRKLMPNRGILIPLLSITPFTFPKQWMTPKQPGLCPVACPKGKKN